MSTASLARTNSGQPYAAADAARETVQGSEGASVVNATATCLHRHCPNSWLQIMIACASTNVDMCIDICTYVYIYICIARQTQADTDRETEMQTDTYVYVCVQVHIHLCERLYVHVVAFVCLYVCSDVNIDIHYTHSYERGGTCPFVCVCICICTCTCAQVLWLAAGCIFTKQEL